MNVTSETATTPLETGNGSVCVRERLIPNGIGYRTRLNGTRLARIRLIRVTERFP